MPKLYYVTTYITMYVLKMCILKPINSYKIEYKDTIMFKHFN